MTNDSSDLLPMNTGLSPTARSRRSARHNPCGPGKLYLIAHASTRQIPGVDAARWQLDETGREQAAALALQPFWNCVDRLLLSSESKTRLTAAPLMERRRLPAASDARFDELRRTPEWTDDYTARVAELFRRPHKSVAGWEPASAAAARFRAGVEDWTFRYPHETLALVGHGLTLSLYRAHLLGQRSVALRDWQALPFAAVACVEAGTIIQDFAVPPGVPYLPRNSHAPAERKIEPGASAQGAPTGHGGGAFEDVGAQ